MYLEAVASKNYQHTCRGRLSFSGLVGSLVSGLYLDRPDEN